MAPRRRPATPVTTRDESLDMTPVRSSQVRERRLDSGLVQLSYPLTFKPWFASLADLLGLWDSGPKEKTVELDEMGTWAWDRLDGTRTVRQLAREFEREYQLNAREAETAVTAFITMLGKRGIVGLA